MHDVLSGEGSSLASVALLACATLLVAAGSAAWANPAGASAPQIERDSVLLRVDVQDDGSAKWQIEYRTRLDDPSTTQAFRDLQSDIDENPEEYSSSFFDGIDSTVATAENSTGREMAAENYSVNADVRHLPRRYGVVVYQFTWRGFAVVDGDTLQVGDALAGFFLGENERLLLTWPSGHEFETVEPSPDERRDRSVIWTGPMEFGPDEPRLVVEDPPPSPRVPWLATAVIAGAFVAGAGAWLLRRRRGSISRGEAEGDATLLSNEERVIRVLENQGGRARQQEIVDSLDWTEAKTSRVISTLREQGRVDSFRLGRENVLALADVEE